MVAECRSLQFDEEFEDRYPRTPRRKLLGRGAFGSIYGVMPAGDATVKYVAKEIQVSSLSVQKQHEALSEVDLLKQVNHPHVVTLIDTMLRHGALYIVMELASGGDLAMKVRAQQELGQRFAERTIMVTFVQLASALHFVHNQRILHRDLKPANVFVFGTGELETCIVKLGDFGLGKAFDSTTCEARSVVGSPSYFAPEVCDGQRYGRKADAWSLGAVLYELSTLKVPFLGKTILHVAMLICKTEPAPLPDEYSPELRDLVGQLLQKNPVARPGMKAVCQDPFVKQFMVLAETREATLGATQSTAPESMPEGESRESSTELPRGLPVHREEDSRAFVDIIAAAFSEHDLGKQGKLPLEVFSQLLQLVAPGLSEEAVADVLASTKCAGGESVEIRSFLDWLVQ